MTDEFKSQAKWLTDLPHHLPYIQSAVYALYLRGQEADDLAYHPTMITMKWFEGEDCIECRIEDQLVQFSKIPQSGFDFKAHVVEISEYIHHADDYTPDWFKSERIN